MMCELVTYIEAELKVLFSPITVSLIIQKEWGPLNYHMRSGGGCACAGAGVPQELSALSAQFG